MLSFQEKLNQLASQIFDALIMSLELPEAEAKNVRSLNKALENNVRLLHYPPVSSQLAAEGFLGRLGAHRDWRFVLKDIISVKTKNSEKADINLSIFTLLFQDQYGGLEFHDNETDTFVPATPKEGVLYLNIGDMFQRISNGRFSHENYPHTSC